MQHYRVWWLSLSQEQQHHMIVVCETVVVVVVVVNTQPAREYSVRVHETNTALRRIQMVTREREQEQPRIHYSSDMSS